MEDDSGYHRKVQTSVTNFLYCGDDWLLLKRGAHKRVDPNRLNGIGGRIEPGEDPLAAVIRETKEETGYDITPADIELTTLGRLEGGYAEDWVMYFFRTKVDKKLMPHGTKTDDGEFLWLNKDAVLDSEYELVDDLNYCFKDIVEGTTISFFNATMNMEEKMESIRLSRLDR